jgi:hypothetical protein
VPTEESCVFLSVFNNRASELGYDDVGIGRNDAAVLGESASADV